ncbi:Glycosyl_transferase family 2 protein [Hexamita inflata]|uniref:Glycosyl transferase family 2 protein n=1 Tax=Hexamita inflata TaxID=28002 RepID=A0AA86UT89_9EUKA|nr:Glycosyl transferase family 2 protein [Hexamita inflata]
MTLCILALAAEPQISLVLTVYNQAKYLNDTLTNLLLQTYQDFEIVCVNDASTDNSVEIIQEFMEKTDKIVLVHQEYNRGTLNTRVLGIRSSRGKYIIQFDPDDSFTSYTVLEELSAYIEYDIDFYHFNEVWLVNGLPIQQCDRTDPLQPICYDDQIWANPRHDFLTHDQLQLELMSGQLGYLVHGKMIKRSVYLQATDFIQPLVDRYSIYEDDCSLMFGVSLYIESYKKINLYGYNYNIHPDSVIRDAQKSTKFAIQFVKDNRAAFIFINFNIMAKRRRSGLPIAPFTITYGMHTQYFLRRITTLSWMQKCELCTSSYLYMQSVQNYIDMCSYICQRSIQTDFIEKGVCYEY